MSEVSSSFWNKLAVKTMTKEVPDNGTHPVVLPQSCHNSGSKCPGRIHASSCIFYLQQISQLHFSGSPQSLTLLY
jgi:hypothetical protein